MIHFIWDAEKAETNKKKHDVSFEAAAHVFEDPNCLILFDAEHSDNEDRFIAIGKVEKLLFVVYTERGPECYRLISARLATRKERMLYDNSNL